MKEKIKKLLHKYERNLAIAEEIEEGGLISDIFEGIIRDLKKISNFKKIVRDLKKISKEE